MSFSCNSTAPYNHRHDWLQLPAQWAMIVGTLEFSENFFDCIIQAASWHQVDVIISNTTTAITRGRGHKNRSQSVRSLHDLKMSQTEIRLHTVYRSSTFFFIQPTFLSVDKDIRSQSSLSSSSSSIQYRTLFQCIAYRALRQFPRTPWMPW